MLNAVHLYSLIGFVNGVVALSLAVYFLKKYFNPLSKGFGFFCLSISLWSFGYSVWLLQTNEASALIWIRIAMGFCYFIPASFLWFSKTLVDQNPENSKTRIFYWILPAFVGVLNSSPFIIEKVEPRLFFPYWPVPGIGMYFVCTVFNFTVIYSLYLMAKQFRTAEGLKKYQLTVIFVGVLLVWLGGSTNWLLWYNIPVAPLPNFFVGLCLCIVFYGIVRKRLFDINQIAEIAREMKLSTLGLMTASINHELRNPLFIAKGRIEAHLDAVESGQILELYQEVEKSRETLMAVGTQLDRAFNIMQKLSEVVRMQKQEIPQGTQNLNQVIQNVLRFISYEIDLRKIRISCRISEDSLIEANLLQAEEIFFNLLTNAMHSLKKEGNLEIVSYSKDKKVIVRINDNGSGIPKENIKKIFDPFYSTKGEKGTGLGLFITKQLLEQNGGKISVESVFGEGTTFTVIFKQALGSGFHGNGNLEELPNKKDLSFAKLTSQAQTGLSLSGLSGESLKRVKKNA